jgi:hypothetical protein
VKLDVGHDQNDFSRDSHDVDFNAFVINLQPHKYMIIILEKLYIY